MKLKTRLFLSVGGLFIIFFLVALFLEKGFVHKHLLESEQTLKKKIIDANYKRLQQFDEFLGLNLVRLLAGIDAFLFELYTSHGTQNAASDKLSYVVSIAEQNSWIDFVQLSVQDKTVGIQPGRVKLRGARISSKNSTVQVQVEGEKKPLFGIPAIEEKNLFFLTTKENTSDLLKYLEEHPQKKQEAVSLQEKRDGYLQDLAKTKEYASPQIVSQFLGDVNRSLDREEILQLAKIIASFPQDLHLEGIAIASNKTGKALLTEDIFFGSRIFSEPSYFAQFPLNSASVPIPSQVAIVEDRSKLFWGNTLKDPPGQYLTVAVSLEDILQRLAIAVDQTALLLFKGKIVSAYDQKGMKIPESKYPALPLENMTQQMGSLPLQGVSFDYMRMQPFKTGDLAFILLQPNANNFSVISFLTQGTEDLIHSLSWNMSTIAVVALVFALFFLASIARRITGPIGKLADASSKVADGHFENIAIPEKEVKRKDEIGVLIRSFDEMVKGLQDREKVRGVLNKVVSKEIASEILNGNVHLGGEERQVAVLFADIRGFTHLTEKMHPKEVILLLNECMTKISNPIDANGGVIDKYIGDEVMALFGAPISAKDSALKAVMSAAQMMDYTDKWNTERKIKNLPPIEIGIGVHIGPVVAGNMGAENRLNYTVLGANVNLASRLCNAAGPNEILITEAVLLSPGVKERIEVEALLPMKLKGFTEEVKVFRIKQIKRDSNAQF